MSANLVHIEGWLRSQELLDMVMLAQTACYKPSTTFGGSSDARSSLVSWRDLLPGDRLGDKFHELARAGAAALGVDILSGEPRAVQLTHYPKGGYYRAHSDVEFQRVDTRNDRKVSISIPLIGPPTLKMTWIDTPNMRAGDVIMFPSWQPHEVPPSEEPRWSLVAWAEGPRWR